MKVCFIAEGCYPYVVGGVSSWIHNMIRLFPNIEFLLVTVISDRSTTVSLHMSWQQSDTGA